MISAVDGYGKDLDFGFGEIFLAQRNVPSRLIVNRKR